MRSFLTSTFDTTVIKSVVTFTVLFAMTSLPTLLASAETSEVRVTLALENEKREKRKTLCTNRARNKFRQQGLFLDKDDNWQVSNKKGDALAYKDISSKQKKALKDGMKFFNRCIDNPTGVAEETNVKCEAATTSFHDAINELKKSCGKAKMSRAGTSCEGQIRKCNLCQSDSSFYQPNPKKSPSKVECDDFTPAEYILSDILQGAAQSGFSSEEKEEEFKTIEQDYNNCPAYASESLKDLKKENREEAKELRAQLKEIEESEADMEKASHERKNEMESLQEQATERIEQAKEEQKALEEHMKAMQQDDANNIYIENQKIQQAQQAYRELNLQSRQISNEYLTTKDEIKSECHRAALAKQRINREEAKKLINAGMYTSGGFNSLLKSVGLDRKTKGRKQAKRFENDCLADSITQSKLRAANRDRLTKLEGLKLKRLQMKELEQGARNKIAEILRGSSPRMRDQIKKLSESQERLRKDLNDLSNKMLNAQKRGYNLERMEQQKITRARMDYNQEKNRVAEAKNYITLRDRFAKGSSEDGATSTAIGDHTALLNESESLIAACNCCDEESSVCTSARGKLQFDDRQVCGAPRPTKLTGGYQDQTQ